MTPQEQLDAFRELADDDSTPSHWSDTKVLRWLNEGQVEAARRARLFEDRTTAAICEITIVPDQAVYAVDPRVIFIRRASILYTYGALARLTKVDFRDLDNVKRGWEIEDSVDWSRYWTPWDAQKIRIETPALGGTIKLWVIREPLAPIALASQATPVAVASITSAAGVATATLVTPDPTLATGDNLTFAGANETEYNGAHDITVVDPSTVTYTIAGTPASPATGTITAARNTLLTACELAPRHHMGPVHWALHRAFAVPDVDKQDTAKASYWLSQFEDEFGKRSSAFDENWIHRHHGMDEYEGLY